MNSYYSTSLPPPPNYYPPNYNHPHHPNPPSNYNYNYQPGPAAPNYNYPPQQPPNLYYNNTIPYPQPPQQQPQTTPPSTLTITTSPHDSSLTLLTPLTSHPTEPQYTAKLDKYRKPHVTLSRGSSHPTQAPLGTAIMHTFSSTTDCTLTHPSQPPFPFPAKYSSLTGSFTITHPLLRGPWKWKPNQLTGTTLELIDGEGRKMAKIKVTSGMSALSREKKAMGKGKRLEIFVPLPEGVLDVVVLTGLVAMVGTRGTMEAAGEVVGAVAGV